MIQIIDSIMGSGKTTWAINYMNSHPEERFIYIAPTLSEVRRICDACTSIGMIQPSNDVWNKTHSLKKLVYDNNNVATTHAMLARIAVDEDFREHLQVNGYHLILDETVEVLSEVKNLEPGDVSLVLNNLAKCDEETGLVTWTSPEDLKIARYVDLKTMALAGTLVVMANKMFMWLLPYKFLDSMANLTIMTFMFQGSHLSYYLQAHDKDWVLRYVNNGKLCDGLQDLSDAKKLFREKLHVYDGPMNDIGKGEHALSATWWKNHTKQGKQVMDNAYNYFRHKMEVSSDKAAWALFKSKNNRINGYQKCEVPFNSRATNMFIEKNTVAYLVNVFEHPSVREWFNSDRGGNVQIDQDSFALCTLLQWLWRFSIRKGEDLYAYIPSSRMRRLLSDWLAG